MKTKILKIENPNDLEKIKIAAKALRDGKLVVFPTETVYGLGGDGLNPKTCKNIYLAKGRPSDNPLILHIARNDQLEALVREIPEVAKKCMEKFWPGPLTMIFNRSDIVPDEATGGLDTVAIRMPSHKIANAILNEADIPVAAPSANTSGRPSPTNANHVIDDLFSKVDYIVDSGFTDVGIESTVLDVTVDPPMILRPGGITLEMLEDAVGTVLTDNTAIDANDKRVPKSPGQKYKHYAPKAEAYCFAGNLKNIVNTINKKIKDQPGKKIAVLATEETQKDYLGAYKVINLGSRENMPQIAHNLFYALRECDELNVDLIYAEGFEFRGIGTGIMNRLLKACGGKITLGL